MVEHPIRGVNQTEILSPPYSLITSRAACFVIENTYRSVIDRIALKSITATPPRPFDNDGNAVHDPAHEPVHGDSRQSNDTTVSGAFVLGLACICPLDSHTARHTGPFHLAIYTHTCICTWYARARLYIRVPAARSSVAGDCRSRRVERINWSMHRGISNSVV